MRLFAHLKSCLKTKAARRRSTPGNAAVADYFATRPLIPIEGATAVNLLDLLRAPAVSSPGS